MQLFRFFELVEIKYVNIIDHSCRSFNRALKIPIEKREERFKEEQKYNVKHVAFGKRSKRRSDGKRSKRRSDGKRTNGKRLNSKKYTRKI